MSGTNTCESLTRGSELTQLNKALNLVNDEIDIIHERINALETSIYPITVHPECLIEEKPPSDEQAKATSPLLYNINSIKERLQGVYERLSVLNNSIDIK